MVCPLRVLLSHPLAVSDPPEADVREPRLPARSGRTESFSDSGVVQFILPTKLVAFWLVGQQKPRHAGGVVAEVFLLLTRFAPANRGETGEPEAKQR